jgi:hypothetical protein
VATRLPPLLVTGGTAAGHSAVLGGRTLAGTRAGPECRYPADAKGQWGRLVRRCADWLGAPLLRPVRRLVGPLRVGGGQSRGREDHRRTSPSWGRRL